MPERCLAIVGHERVEVHEVADPLGDVLEGTGDDEPAVGEAEQHDPGQILVQHLVDDVADMGAEVDHRAGEVGPLADAGQARGEHLMARRRQPAPNVTEPVGPAPATVHQHVRRHPPS